MKRAPTVMPAAGGTKTPTGLRAMHQPFSSLGRARSVCWLNVLFVGVLALSALWNLQGGELQEWDEGLTARHAQNALHYDRWLWPSDSNGNFSRAFTKPPLLIWQVALGLRAFDFSAFGLRVGTALSVLGTGLVAFRFALRLGLSRAVAMSWGALIVLSGGALKWARVVNIEVTLVAFSLGALYCFARALEKSGRTRLWALSSGVCLLCAFLTKQVMVAVAAMPILVVALLQLRRGSWRATLCRLILAGVLPSLGALLWVWFAYRDSAGRAVASMVEFTVVKRVRGFSNGQHVAALNRLHGFVVEAMSPFDWEVAALGLVVLLAGTRLRRSPGALLVVGYLLTALLLLEGVTRSLLPWYSWSIVVPLFLGLAHVLGEGVRYGARWLWAVADGDPAAPRAGEEPLGASLSLLALGELLMVISRLWQLHASRLGVISITLLVFSVGIAVARRVRLRSVRLGLVGFVGLVPVIALVLGLCARDAYWRDPGPLLSLMAPVMRSGARHVAVAASIAGHENTHRALFGPSAEPVRRAPWRKGQTKFDAYVEPRQLPREFTPFAGVQLFRSAGVVAWRGNLEQDPAPDSQLLAALDAGPLTFEAEEGASAVSNSLAVMSGKLGRRARHLDRSFYKPRPTSLFKLSDVRLPAGRYVVVASVRTECSSEHPGPAGSLNVRIGAADAARSIRCASDGLQQVRTTVEAAAEGELRVTVEYRAGDLWLDDVSVSRVR
jgi:4-amino-4-deoxy-L-arabinose transferase-like glycosyltransferase